MKIAIITIQDANNYGAILQAFATKHIFSNYGNVNILNYHNPHLSGHLDLLRFKFNVHGIKMLLHDISRITSRRKVIKKFRSFINHNLGLTKSLKSEDLWDKSLDDFDVYVCGSDQIWNPQIVNEKGNIDKVYFLGFVKNNKKKISFASSMGSYVFNGEKLKELKLLLSDFSFLSVRESKTAHILSKQLDRNVHHVFDPTLHLQIEDWKAIIEFKKNPLKPDFRYILVYTVPRTPLLSSVVSYCRKKLGMKVVLIDQSLKPAVYCDVHVKDSGIEEFLDLYKDASFVITDSFHGTCFSLIFEKPFVSVAPGNRSNRIENLLEFVGLSQFLVRTIDDFDQIFADIDFGKVSSILSKKSKSILHKIEIQLFNN